MSDDTTKQVPAPAGQFTPAKWTDKFRGMAEAQRKAEQTSAAFFSIKAGVLAFQGTPIAGNAMDVVVLESIHERTFYPEKFDGSGGSPVCYAFSPDGADMVPHPDVTEKQHATCKGCPKAEWGSADNGKGQACREGRRLSLMSAADLTSPDKVMSATAGYLRLPVTSVKGFGSYVQGVVGGSDLPLFCHVSRVSVVPDPKVQVRVTFTRVGGIEDDAVMEAVFNRATAEAQAIAFPYPKNEEPKQEATPKKARKF